LTRTLAVTVGVLDLAMILLERGDTGELKRLDLASFDFRGAAS